MAGLYQVQELAEKIKKLKSGGKKTVFTNGCFDILHVGHVRYLAEARQLGDYLIIGLNADESVRALKGPLRPINQAADRAEVLLALRSVDGVVFFSELTAERLVAELQPDIYVKGGDYCMENLPEAKIVSSYGGETIFVPLVPEKSTTKTLQLLRGDQ